MSNPVCGDLVRLEVVVRNGRLESYAYQVKGCWPVQGCLEFLGDKWMGMEASALLAWPFQEFINSVNGVPGSKRHAFSLSYRALVASVLKSMEYSQMFGDKTEERV